MATAEKTRLEQRQREEAAERKEKRVQWQTKLFRYTRRKCREGMVGLPHPQPPFFSLFPLQAHRRELAVHDSPGEEAAGAGQQHGREQQLATKSFYVAPPLLERGLLCPLHTLTRSHSEHLAMRPGSNHSNRVSGDSSTPPHPPLA